MFNMKAYVHVFWANYDLGNDKRKC